MDKRFNSTYNKETGESFATIKTKFGTFTGYAKAHPEDKPDRFTGCQLAELRALLKATRAEYKYHSTQLKALTDHEKMLKCYKMHSEDGYGAIAIRKHIKSVKEKVDLLKKQIDILSKALYTQEW